MNSISTLKSQASCLKKRLRALSITHIIGFTRLCSNFASICRKQDKLFDLIKYTSSYLLPNTRPQGSDTKEVAIYQATKQQSCYRCQEDGLDKEDKTFSSQSTNVFLNFIWKMNRHCVRVLLTSGQKSTQRMVICIQAAYSAATSDISSGN